VSLFFLTLSFSLMKMKSTRKVTRIKLQVDMLNDFILLGLVTSEPDYKLSFILNNKFNISLRNNSPVNLKGNDGSDLLFSRFSDSTESPDRIYNLISNRSGKHFLIRKLKNVDYILHVHNPENEDNISQITSKLREIHTITAVFNLDIGSIKDRNLHLVIQ
jgi:hypothetical protein